MKNLIFLLIVLFSCSLLAAPPPKPPMTVEGSDITFHGNVTIFGDVWGAVSKTKQNTTFYVRVGGDNDNDCLSAGNACATPQGAIDKIPDYIYHTILVDIGPGTFPAFELSTKAIKRPGTLTIQGTLGAATLATGSTSGTWDGDGANIYECSDSTQVWTANDLRGKLIRENRATPEYRVVRQNDGTTIEYVREAEAICTGVTYDVLEQKTIITGVISAELPAACIVEGIKPVETYDLSSMFPVTGLFIRDIFFNEPALAIIGFAATESSGTIERCKAEAAWIGYMFLGLGDRWHVLDCYAQSSPVSGFNFYYNSNSAYMNGSYSYQCSAAFDFYRSHGHYNIEGCGGDDGGYGFYFRDAGTFNLAGSDRIFVDDMSYDCIRISDIQNINIDQNAFSVLSNCNYAGISINDEEDNTCVKIQQITIDTADTGIYIRGQSSVLITQNVTSSSITNYGLDANIGARVVAANVAGLTGGSGDFTINSGETTFSWTDVAGVGDSVINVANGTVVKYFTQ